MKTVGEGGGGLQRNKILLVIMETTWLERIKQWIRLHGKIVKEERGGGIPEFDEFACHQVVTYAVYGKGRGEGVKGKLMVG